MKEWVALFLVWGAACADPVLLRCDREFERCERVIERACKADDRFCFGSPANQRWRLPLVVQCSDNYAECLATESEAENACE